MPENELDLADSINNLTESITEALGPLESISDTLEEILQLLKEVSPK